MKDRKIILEFTEKQIEAIKVACEFYARMIDEVQRFNRDNWPMFIKVIDSEEDA